MNEELHEPQLRVRMKTSGSISRNLPYAKYNSSCTINMESAKILIINKLLHDVT